MMGDRTAEGRRSARESPACVKVANMKTPLCVHDFLDRAGLVYAHRTAVFDEPDQPGGSWSPLTYGQFSRMARNQALALDRMNVGYGERVAVVSKNSARLLTSFFGVSGYGRVLVPINFRLQPDEVAYIVEHSGASVLLVDHELAPLLADVPCQHRIVLDADGDRQLFNDSSGASSAEPQPWPADEDAIATINYTSGTTARPKGVALTHRNLWINSTVFGLHLGVSDRDVYLHTLPMFHVNGWGMPYILAAMGASQVVLRQVDGMEILRRVEKYGVTVLCGAPTVAKMILEAARDWIGPVPGRGQVRMVIAGAPPPTQLIERIESELGWEFIQIYGLTETAPQLTINRATADDQRLTVTERAARLGRAGVPTLGVSLATSNDGEVLARGNVVLDHYWRDPEATDDALQDGWFRTGDGGQIDEEAHLLITDRKKDLIISGGENVSSIEVEDTLYHHPDVSEVAVIGRPHEKWGETVVALVVWKGQKPPDEAELIDFCRQRIAHFKCPTSIEFRDSLPRTATGKLQKFKLRSPAVDQD